MNNVWMCVLAHDHQTMRKTETPQKKATANWPSNHMSTPKSSRLLSSSSYCCVQNSNIVKKAMRRHAANRPYQNESCVYRSRYMPVKGKKYYCSLTTATKQHENSNNNKNMMKMIAITKNDNSSSTVTTTINVRGGFLWKDDDDDKDCWCVEGGYSLEAFLSFIDNRSLFCLHSLSL